MRFRAQAARRAPKGAAAERTAIAIEACRARPSATTAAGAIRPRHRVEPVVAEVPPTAEHGRAAALPRRTNLLVAGATLQAAAGHKTAEQTRMELRRRISRQLARRQAAPRQMAPRQMVVLRQLARRQAVRRQAVRRPLVIRRVARPLVALEDWEQEASARACRCATRGPASAGGGPEKGSPCGTGGYDDVQPIPISGVVTEFHAGETIEVDWIDTVAHPGHFRIALAENRTDLKDPDIVQDSLCSYDETKVPQGAHGNVLADGLFFRSRNGFNDAAGKMFSYQVTLPNQPCEKCTLQVLQVMEADIQSLSSCHYFHCADIKILPASGSGGGGGNGPHRGLCGAGGAGGGGTAGGATRGAASGAAGGGGGGGADGSDY